MWFLQRNARWRCAALTAVGVPHAVTARGREDDADGLLPGVRVCEARQVHGVAVVRADVVEAGGLRACADAVISRDPRMAAAVRTADCLPVLLTSADGRAVAAVHAGWRGLVGWRDGDTPERGRAGVLEAAVAEGGFGGGSSIAAIGPAICGACFEVGDEVAAWFPPAVVRRAAGAKPHVDLVAAARLRLHACGVRQVNALPRCTRASPALCHSFRRDGRGMGHHIALIAPRG